MLDAAGLIRAKMPRNENPIGTVAVRKANEL
jgi:enterobacterial common antigen polymerase